MRACRGLNGTRVTGAFTQRLELNEHVPAPCGKLVGDGARIVANLPDVIDGGLHPFVQFFQLSQF